MFCLKDFQTVKTLGISFLVIIYCADTINSEENWRWQSNSRNNRRPYYNNNNEYNNNYIKRPSNQYEVSENIDNYPELYENHRPINNQYNRFPPPNNRYPPNNNRYPPNNNRYPSNNRYPANNRYPPTAGIINNQHYGSAVLAGPVPSWEKEPVIKNLDRCKCAAKFNCNTPGVSFGHCDVGKQYCCYNSKGDALDGSYTPPSQPVHSIENGVLAGPDGPVDFKPVQQHVNEEDGDEENPGVLVGPGGPTGVIGRPTINRPVYYPSGPNLPQQASFGQRPFRGPY